MEKERIEPRVADMNEHGHGPRRALRLELEEVRGYLRIRRVRAANRDYVRRSTGPGASKFVGTRGVADENHCTRLTQPGDGEVRRIDLEGDHLDESSRLSTSA